MRCRLPMPLVATGLLAACAGASVIKPVELLDERTGISVAALRQPIELVRGGMLIAGKRSSFVYLGPVEWDRMGDFRHALWLHLAPGNDIAYADILGPSAVTLVLADGSLELSHISAPRLGTEPYRPAAPWGQTAYFDVTVETLRRMAASPQLSIRCRAADGSSVQFVATGDSRATLGAYLQARSLTAD